MRPGVEDVRQGVADIRPGVVAVRSGVAKKVASSTVTHLGCAVVWPGVAKCVCEAASRSKLLQRRTMRWGKVRCDKLAAPRHRDYCEPLSHPSGGRDQT